MKMWLFGAERECYQLISAYEYKAVQMCQCDSDCDFSYQFRMVRSHTDSTLYFEYKFAMRLKSLNPNGLTEMAYSMCFPLIPNAWFKSHIESPGKLNNHVCDDDFASGFFPVQ